MRPGTNSNSNNLLASALIQDGRQEVLLHQSTQHRAGMHLLYRARTQQLSKATHLEARALALGQSSRPSNEEHARQRFIEMLLITISAHKQLSC